jgi:hypothetical protein
MTKQHVPLAVPDLSALAKSLRAQLARLEHPPTHVEMLNLLAKAAGHANYQALRADAQARSRLTAEPPPDPADHGRIEKVLRHFDDAGRMLRWPGRSNHQLLCLWAIWSRIPAATRMSEAEINSIIIEAHTFGDHAILRRSLVDTGMLVRTPDGRLYRRVEQKPDADAAALLAALSHRA